MGTALSTSLTVVAIIAGVAVMLWVSRREQRETVSMRLAQVDAIASRIRVERIHRQARQPRQSGRVSR